MKCPNCVDTDLSISDRKNVEIDFCPKCRGVWLDKGELDKIIELSNTSSNTSSNDDRGDRYDRDDRGDRGDRDDRYDRGDRDDRDYGKRKKKSSMLGDLFDF